jgi:hypothetical protein
MAPPWGLCVDAAENGFSIVSVRRPGFGETSPVSAIAEEVRLLSDFLEEAPFENAVMIVDGAARPWGAEAGSGARADRVHAARAAGLRIGLVWQYRAVG